MSLAWWSPATGHQFLPPFGSVEFPIVPEFPLLFHDEIRWENRRCLRAHSGGSLSSTTSVYSAKIASTGRRRSSTRSEKDSSHFFGFDRLPNVKIVHQPTTTSSSSSLKLKKKRQALFYLLDIIEIPQSIYRTNGFLVYSLTFFFLFFSGLLHHHFCNPVVLFSFPFPIFVLTFYFTS